MSAATVIAQAFGEDADLYTSVLGLPPATSTQTITASQLRKAYYKRALIYHPDKQDPSSSSKKEREEAKLKFQAISIAYNTLSDSEKRKEYDETGEIYDDDEGLGSMDKSGSNAWAEYFRGIFGSVSPADIDKFTLQYKCSEEEERDVLKYCKQFKGNLNKMLECVMCSDDVDKKRWVEDYILPAIKNHMLDDYTKELERTMRQPDEIDSVNRDDDDDSETESEEDSEEEVIKSKKKTIKKKLPPAKKSRNPKYGPKKSSCVKGEDADDDLIAAIRGNSVSQRQEAFSNLMAGLEERYGGGSKGKKKRGKKVKKIAFDDIPDEEFEKIRGRLDSQRKS